MGRVGAVGGSPCRKRAGWLVVVWRVNAGTGENVAGNRQGWGYLT
jgi:hypothetical protein